MSIWQRIVCVVVWSAIAVVIVVTIPGFNSLDVRAAGLQTAQFTETSAVLVGPKADSPVPLYLRPAANQPSVGYGINGHSVTVLEQVASFLPEADQASAWNHVRLEDAPYTEGWIQGRFLLLQENNSLDAAE